MNRGAFVACVAAAVGTALGAQTPAPAPVSMVGQVAPDFTLRVSNKDGFAAKPFVLSEHRGETVVLAFFFAARTRG